MEYINRGKIQGVLTKEPIRVSKGVLSLQLEIQKPLKNGRVRKMYPSFVIYRDKIADYEDQDIEVGDILEIEYELETKRKVGSDGKKAYFDNRVVSDVKVIEESGAKEAA